MVEYNKPLSQLTNKEWRGSVIALTFIGVFIFFFGLYNKDWNMMKIGLILVTIGIFGGLILHFFFGIKIIQLRNDLRYKNHLSK